MKESIKVPKIVNYLPYEERPVDSQYKATLQKILEKGSLRGKVEFHGGKIQKYFVNPMEFKMAYGFPVITERDISEYFRYAIAEIIGFIHGATTLTELEKFGLPKWWWKRWTKVSHITDSNGTPKFDLPENDVGEHLGRFSYGGIWASYPDGKGGILNQWENIIKVMMKYPSAFTHRVTNWYPPGIIVPEGKRQVVVAPCHGDVQIDLDVERRLLTLIQLQRSADVATGVPYNMIHYPVIGMMLSCVLGYEFDTYHHVMVDSHIYMDKQLENVKILLEREPRKLPTVTLNFEPTGDPVKDFFAIRPEHFQLSDYDPHPAMKIDTEV